jgi:hypothetical protein
MIEAQEFLSDFGYLCQASGLDPEEALKILNAQDWHPGFTIVSRNHLRGIPLGDPTMTTMALNRRYSKVAAILLAGLISAYILFHHRAVLGGWGTVGHGSRFTDTHGGAGDCGHSLCFVSLHAADVACMVSRAPQYRCHSGSQLLYRLDLPRLDWFHGVGDR